MTTTHACFVCLLYLRPRIYQPRLYCIACVQKLTDGRYSGGQDNLLFQAETCLGECVRCRNQRFGFSLALCSQHQQRQQKKQPKPLKPSLVVKKRKILLIM
jgi:hypothetical protein